LREKEEEIEGQIAQRKGYKAQRVGGGRRGEGTKPGRTSHRVGEGANSGGITIGWGEAGARDNSPVGEIEPRGIEEDMRL
jgi:hypothetical protein